MPAPDNERPHRGRRTRAMEKLTIWLPEELYVWVQQYSAAHRLYQQELGRLAFDLLKNTLEQAADEKVERLIAATLSLREIEAPSTRRGPPRPRRRKPTPDEPTEQAPH